MWHASCDGLISRAVLFLGSAPSCAEHVIGMSIMGLTIDTLSIAYVIWRRIVWWFVASEMEGMCRRNRLWQIWIELRPPQATARVSQCTGDWLVPEPTWTPLSKLEPWFLCHPARSLWSLYRMFGFTDRMFCHTSDFSSDIVHWMPKSQWYIVQDTWHRGLYFAPGYLSRYSDLLRTELSADQIPVAARFSAPVQTCSGPTKSLSRKQSGRNVALTTSPHLALRLKRLKKE
jgi:hypothetical protein